MNKITPQKIKRMPYVELMAFLEEINRPPGGKDSIRQIVQNCFITKDSRVLDVGCNTGYCAFEIVHLTKCKVIGIDVSPEMIRTAKKLQQKDPARNLVKFTVADAETLPFRDKTFNVVMSGGSTAFIDDKEKAIREYERVLMPWGFIADINFYYRIKPPIRLIRRLNTLMKINIEPWDINYWLDLYDRCALERYFIYTDSVKAVNRAEIKNYCTQMAIDKNLSKAAKDALRNRLVYIMELFNENHKYLDYGIFILRKRPTKEQITLFGT